jgi:predicted AAA+ superfamily ATPase
MASLPAVLLVGPRATGKTTTALRRARTTLRLDRPAVAASVDNDPDAVLADCEPPVLIDEWQVVPSVLGAVKRSVDTTAGPGHYILTGSSRADLQAEGWPATGRVVRVPVWPMNVRERLGLTERRSIIDHLFDGTIEDLEPATDGLDVRSYVDLALDSGFPELVGQTSQRARRAWLAAYVDQVVLRDAPFSGHDRDPQRLRAYLSAIAASSAEVTTSKTLHDTAGITRTTGQAYDNLLELLSITERAPALASNRLRRLTRAPKRYVVDPGLLAPLLRVDTRTVVRDARLVGQVIDTFVTAQLRSELAIADASPSMFHLRQSDGRHEADLVLEGPLGRIVAIEIKAHSTPTRRMARHLEWLRDELGNQFALGALFHTGPRPFELSDRLWALPISALWG